MYELKIRKIGNSLGIVLPKELLASLCVREKDTLYLTKGPADSYRLTPQNETFFRQMREAERIMSEDHDLLRKLASR